MHAGGVLIAPGKLTDFCPLYAAQGTESTISQFDMRTSRHRPGEIRLPRPDHAHRPRLGDTVDPAWQGDFALEKIPARRPAAYQVFSNANTTRYSSSSRAACATW